MCEVGYYAEAPIRSMNRGGAAAADRPAVNTPGLGFYSSSSIQHDTLSKRLTFY
jgi:hypothetical protein